MKPLTILVITVDCPGHVNACIGSTRPLLARGHRVIFMLNESNRGKVAPHGFEEYIIDSRTNRDTDHPGEAWANDLVSLKAMGPYTHEEKYHKIIDVFTLGPAALETTRQMDSDAKLAISRLKPDLLFIDAYCTPSIYYSGLPWVNNVSIMPLALCSNDHDSLPPSASGIRSDSPRNGRWIAFKKLNLLYKYSSVLNDFYETVLGYPRYPNDRILPYEGALLSLYAIPEEFNFPAMRKKGWFNIEVFNKNVSQKPLPLEKLLPGSFIKDDLDGHWSGKWVYLSMGSMGSIELHLMRRLMDAISGSTHKFIVSKGPRHGEFTLPRNAWGERYLPQTALLPLMDLVITHAGNNTTTETFAQGVPMLLMPLFGDQYDNATRVEEMGLGRTLDPFQFTKEQLIETVDDLIADKELKIKLKKASERILGEKKHEELAAEIERRWVKWTEDRKFATKNN